MKLIKNIHPGQIISEEFLVPLGISPAQLAKEIQMSPSSITRIIKGEQAITVETAVKPAAYFDTSEKFWMNLQISYDFDKR